MDKKIARKIAENYLSEIVSDNLSRTVNLLKESEHFFLEDSGVEYQIRGHATYEDKKNKIIRIWACVDDKGFWSTFMPLTICEFVKNGKIYDFTKDEGI